MDSTTNYWGNLNYYLTSKEVDVYEKYASLLELEKNLRNCETNIQKEKNSLLEIIESFKNNDMESLKSQSKEFNTSESIVRNVLAVDLTNASQFICYLIKGDYESLKKMRENILENSKTFEILEQYTEKFSESFSEKITVSQELVKKMMDDTLKIQPLDS